MTPTTHTQLTTEQLTWLLSGIHHTRVGKDGKGFAHVEAWDIRRHLIRCFGFGGYSTDLLSAELVTERETPASGGGRPRFTVVYRCAIRLTVKLKGAELGRWHGIATGDAANTLHLNEIKAELKTVRDSTQEALEKAEAEHGTRQISVTLPDGRRVGTVSLNDDSHKAEITDEAAFKAWVTANYPTEIERKFVAEIRPAFTTRLLAEMTKANAPHVIDTETGEIHEVPGIEITITRSGSHTLRFRDDDAKQAIRQATQGT